jgi:arylsulfatase A-like enzyme
MSQCPDSPPVVLYVSAKNGLPAEEVTWPKMLKTYGYRTAAVGKNIIPVNI